MFNAGNKTIGSTIRIPFSTNLGSGAPGAFSDALEAGDIRVYKNGGTTERASSAGYTVSSSFDTVTGLNHVLIDTSDDTDSGFYVAGDYDVALVPDSETLDSLSVACWIGHFSLENWFRDIDAPVKNVALSNVRFYMELTDGSPGTGLSITVQRQLDAGSLVSASGAASVVEIGSGFYRWNPAAADMNGDSVFHLFTATGARPTGMEFTTKT